MLQLIYVFLYNTGLCQKPWEMVMLSPACLSRFYMNLDVGRGCLVFGFCHQCFLLFHNSDNFSLTKNNCKQFSFFFNNKIQDMKQTSSKPDYMPNKFSIFGYTLYNNHLTYLNFMTQSIVNQSVIFKS